MLACVLPHVRPLSTSSAIPLFTSLAHLTLPFGFLSHIYTDLLETLYVLDTIIWLQYYKYIFLTQPWLVSPTNSIANVSFNIRT